METKIMNWCNAVDTLIGVRKVVISSMSPRAVKMRIMCHAFNETMIVKTPNFLFFFDANSGISAGQFMSLFPIGVLLDSYGIELHLIMRLKN